MRLSYLLIVFAATLVGSSNSSSNLDKVSAIASTQHNQLEHGSTRLLRFVETKEEVDDGDLDDDDDHQGGESEERGVLDIVKSWIPFISKGGDDTSEAYKQYATKLHNLGESEKRVKTLLRKKWKSKKLAKYLEIGKAEQKVNRLNAAFDHAKTAKGRVNIRVQIMKAKNELKLAEDKRGMVLEFNKLASNAA